MHTSNKQGRWEGGGEGREGGIKGKEEFSVQDTRLIFLYPGHSFIILKQTGTEQTLKLYV